MDFNTIWETVSPYLTDTGILTAVSALIVGVVKIVSWLKTNGSTLKDSMAKIKAELEETKTNIAKTYSEAMPTTLTVNIQSLVKDELKKYIENYNAKIDGEVTDKLTLQEEQLALIIKALCYLKSIPDETKTQMKQTIQEETKEEVVTIELKSVAVEEAKKEETTEEVKYAE